MAEENNKVLNMDVWGILRKLTRIHEETKASQSSNVLGLHPADVIRLTSYVTDMVGYIEYLQRPPDPLDMPESTPKEYVVDPPPALQKVENEALIDLQNLLTIAYVEMASCQSIRYGCKLLRFDEARLRQYLARMTSLLAYAAEQYPLDMPESTPRAEVSGEGRTGLNPKK